jgi:hypothetical protein
MVGWLARAPLWLNIEGRLELAVGWPKPLACDEKPWPKLPPLKP